MKTTGFLEWLRAGGSAERKLVRLFTWPWTISMLLRRSMNRCRHGWHNARASRSWAREAEGVAGRLRLEVMRRNQSLWSTLCLGDLTKIPRGTCVGGPRHGTIFPTDRGKIYLPSAYGGEYRLEEFMWERTDDHPSFLPGRPSRTRRFRILVFVHSSLQMDDLIGALDYGVEAPAPQSLGVF